MSVFLQVWHLESGQCLFFAADSRVEYQMWFKEITRGAEYIVAADDVAVPLPTPYYFFPKESSSSTPVGGRRGRNSPLTLSTHTALINKGSKVKVACEQKVIGDLIERNPSWCIA